MILQAAKEMLHRKRNFIPGGSRLSNEATGCGYMRGRVSGQPLPPPALSLEGRVSDGFLTKRLGKYFLAFLNEKVLQKILLEIDPG